MAAELGTLRSARDLVAARDAQQIVQALNIRLKEGRIGKTGSAGAIIVWKLILKAA